MLIPILKRISIVFLSTIILVLPLPVIALATIDRMVMIGTGDVYYLGFIKVYDAHLYALNESDGERILSPEVSKCLKLTYDVELKPEDFITGAETVLKRQHTPEYLEMLRPEIDALHKAYQPVEKGDSYLLCYEAETRKTSLSLNDRTVAVIESEPFSSAYFGIWLSPDQPLSESLQKKLVQSSETANGAAQ
jgi:hypothetical protein